MAWRTIDGEETDPLGQFRELETLVRGFFQPALLLEYLRHFVLFEDASTGSAQATGGLIKKIAAYHQFHAVRAAVRETIKATRADGNRRCGVVWHTQGSGKSISMTCYAAAVMAAPEMENPTIVVVTDRNDLDGQLFGVFASGRELLGEEPRQADSREELRELLANRPSGGIIFTTIQKFSPDKHEARFPLLSDRRNIVVIADEAHRSQYGLRSKLNRDSGQFQYGYAQHLRDALKNAAFIAFTGTPVSLQDRDTRAVFGDYIHVYDIEQAQQDGATVPIYYEGRLAKLELNPDEMPVIDDEVEELTEDEEESAQAHIKRRWAALEKLVGAQPRLERVARDLLAHFDNRQAALPGKAMIVGMSRDICARLYHEITQLRPDWHDPDPAKGKIKVVMTGSSSDKALLQPHVYSKQVKKDLEKRFKNPDDPLQLVIVRDMWLTGFDVPCLHTLYMDKPMQGHNLMQAIARVNRVFKDKPGGLVVDYIGIANELRHAVRDYTNSKGKGRPTVDAAEAFAVMVEKLDIARGLLHGFNYTAYRERAMQLLPGAAEHVLAQTDGKQRFADAVLAMSKAFALCSGMEEALEYRDEIAFLQAIKAVIGKSDGGGTIDYQKREEAMRQIVSRSGQSHYNAGRARARSFSR
jgi:type I restriction enzyme R subunit